jgi:hypothetical protein
MTDQDSRGGDRDRFEIVFEVPQSPHGGYRYEGEDGKTVHGDASGEWTLDADGGIDDIVFFVSPGCVRRHAELSEDE